VHLSRHSFSSFVFAVGQPAAQLKAFS